MILQSDIYLYTIYYIIYTIQYTLYDILSTLYFLCYKYGRNKCNNKILFGRFYRGKNFIYSLFFMLVKTN